MGNVTRRRKALARLSATLVDVASAASVSTASASRALSRPDMVSEALRLRVSQAATKLGYVANVAARALARRRSGLIGVVVGSLESPGVAAALAALDDQLSQAGCTLILATCTTGLASGAHVRALIHRGAEALVFLGVAVPSALGELPDLAALPSVSVDRATGTGFIASAGLDLGRAHSLVVDYLAQLGHRRMAVVAGVDPVLDSYPSAPGLGADSSAVLRAVSLADGPAADALRGILELPDPPTALICSSDALAVAALQACSVIGAHVPAALSLVGLGDTSLARCASPALTTVRIPARSAGIAAADYLLARLAGHANDPVELPIKLVVRGSTGPAPQ